MIILDTCVLRGISLGDSSADFLRTLRAVGTERVAVPWVVMEERVAQQAVKYRETYERAAQSLRSLDGLQPPLLGASLPPLDLERVRDHWRDTYGALVDTLPTSEGALREGVFRESNVLPPSKVHKTVKTGARDTAIWLTAVEYARANPDELVYFVSSNTEDFTDGSSYKPPMDQDVKGLDGRLVHLTSIDDLINTFAERTDTDTELVQQILDLPDVRNAIQGEALRAFARKQWPVTITASLGGTTETIFAPETGMYPTRATVGEVTEAVTYRFKDHEWCVAVVRWRLAGFAVLPEMNRVSAACSWTTSVLFTPDVANPRITVLRSDPPCPVSSAEFDTSGAPRMAPKPLTELFDRESRWVLRAEEAFKAMHQAKGTASLADALDAVFRGAYEATPLEDES
ncbi:PIN domain-containing protein [Streptomyces mirabilis]|uniref:PIN domain-containing protein n=1 Tax=Streptomyces mirabilis TaxID=68239 RepID=UPI0036BFB8EC